MKKVFTILAAVLLTTTVMAQKGQMFVSGNLGFSSDSYSYKLNNVTTEEPASTAFNIMGEFHYKITNKLAIGLGIGYGSTKTFSNFAGQNDKYELFDKASLINLMPSAIYFVDITDKFQYAPQLYINFGFGSTEMDDYDVLNDKVVSTEMDLSTTQFGIYPLSFNYNFTNKFAINLAFGNLYFGASKISDADNEYSNINFNLDLNSGGKLTLRYFFN